TLQSDFEEDPIDLSLNDNLVEVFALAIEDISESIPANSSVVKIVRDTLQYCPTMDVRLYDNAQFTQKEIYYDRMMCSWYSIEHIVSRLNKKDKKRGYFRDYKGPNTQCWCDENQYSPSDECITCYLELKLWITVRFYPVEEVAKSYWPISDENDEYDGEFNPHIHGSDNVSLIDDTPLETWNEWVEPRTYLLSNYDSDEYVDLVFLEIEPDNTRSRNNLELATIPW
ncbi:19392_t:CDS:1, partial [Dentiscutata erythropus]